MLNKLRVLLTQIYIRLFGKCLWIPDDRYNRWLYFLRTGGWANIEEPVTFSDHVLNLKIYQDESQFAQYTDKFAVREYVEKTIGQQYLVKNLGVWEKAEDIPFAQLPERYVLKATHGSGWNIIVKQNAALDKKSAIQRLNGFLQKNYYLYGREKNYRDIKPRIVCEEFIENENGKSIVDFKVFCFGGKAQFYSISYSINGKPYYGLFDLEQGQLEIIDKGKHIERNAFNNQKEKIVALAEKLAAPFAFVRVDFYVTDQTVLFSELTFHSGGGIRPIQPKAIDVYLGKYFV